MAETIIDGTQFNAQNIKFSAPKANASGGKSVNILNKATSSGVRLSTPLVLTWGASDFEGNQKYEMALQFPGDEYKNADTSAWLKNMQDLEKKIKDDAIVYSKDWFGKVHNLPDVINALWTPMLKYPKNKQTGEPDLTKEPTLRVKIPIWEGIWKCEIYDEDGNPMFPNSTNPTVTPLDYLQKGVNLAAVIQCGGLWFANGKFGVTWKLVQAVVQKPRGSLTGKCFIKLKPSDKDRLKAAAPVSEDADEEGGALVEDSDEEDEAEDESEPTPPVPLPVPVAVPTPAPVVAPTPPVVEDEKPKVVKKVVKKKVVA